MTNMFQYDVTVGITRSEVICRTINLKSTIFLLVHFSIFGDLDLRVHLGAAQALRKERRKIDSDSASQVPGLEPALRHFI